MAFTSKNVPDAQLEYIKEQLKKINTKLDENPLPKFKKGGVILTNNTYIHADELNSIQPAIKGSLAWDQPDANPIKDMHQLADYYKNGSYSDNSIPYGVHVPKLSWNSVFGAEANEVHEVDYDLDKKYHAPVTEKDFDRPVLFNSFAKSIFRYPTLTRDIMYRKHAHYFTQAPPKKLDKLTIPYCKYCQLNVERSLLHPHKFHAVDEVVVPIYNTFASVRICDCGFEEGEACHGVNSQDLISLPEPHGVFSSSDVYTRYDGRIGLYNAPVPVAEGGEYVTTTISAGDDTLWHGNAYASSGTVTLKPMYFTVTTS